MLENYEEELFEAMELDKVEALNNKYNIIFKYDFSEIYDEINTNLIIMDKEKDNLCLYYSNFQNIDTNYEYYTINLDNIKNILEKNKIKNKEIPFLPVDDGSHSEIYFNNSIYSISNLGHFEEHNINDVEALNKIFKILKSINKELKSQLKDIDFDKYTKVR